MGRCGGRGKEQHIEKFQKKNRKISKKALKDILSIVLCSCPGTALVPMNFGWVDLGFLLLIKFPFKARLRPQAPQCPNGTCIAKVHLFDLAQENRASTVLELLILQS